MRRVTFDQNTPEWEVWRSKGIGASDAGIILGVSPYMTADELFKNKLDHWNWSVRKSSKAKNAAQLRGTRLEPVARDAYIAFTGIPITTACIIHDAYDWMRASLDGLSEDGQIPVEIKCIKAEHHQTAVGGEVPLLYWPQVQHQLAVADRPFLHYWSYSESGQFTEGERRALVVVTPNKKYIRHLIQKEQDFWDRLQAAALDLGYLKKNRHGDLTSSESVVS